jgi:hypothetical protein
MPVGPILAAVTVALPRSADLQRFFRKICTTPGFWKGIARIAGIDAQSLERGIACQAGVKGEN